jgi:hypothetical protein
MYKRECSLFMRIQVELGILELFCSHLVVVHRIRKRKGFLALIHGFGFHAFIILL